MENEILMIIEKYYRLRAFVRENYNEMNLNSTPEDIDDSAEAFDCGYMCGLSNASETIGNILEMEFKTNDFSIGDFSIGEKYEK